MEEDLSKYTDKELEDEIAKEEVKRWATKIEVNALYGILASSYYRFKAVDKADEVTFHGREILMATRDFLRGLGYTVYYLDTDSLFVNGKYEDAEIIKKLINDFVERTFNVTNIKFGLENYWSKIGFPKSSKGEKVKKKYYGIVHTNKDSKVVNKFEEAGMESLRGDWTRLAIILQDAIKRMQVEEVPKEKMLEFYEDTKVKLYEGQYDPLLVLEKHMGKGDVSEYGKPKMGKNGKMHNTGTPPQIKALKAALETDWVPTEMIEYGTISYLMVKPNAIPKLSNLTKANEIDYSWYIVHQLDPIMYRLGLIERVSKYKKTKEIATNQSTLD